VPPRTPAHEPKKAGLQQAASAVPHFYWVPGRSRVEWESDSRRG
jgi:hypothetical protein